MIIRGSTVRWSAANRKPLSWSFPVALLCVALACGSTANSAQVLLEPNTTATYSWDWYGQPVNHSAGFDTLATMVTGAYQKGTYTRNYRSFMTFDTLDSQSAILSATMDLTITKRTTVTLTNPFSTLDLTLGLPGQFTAEQISDPAFSSQAANSSLIYADLATNGFASATIPFGDFIGETSNAEIVISTPLPISFIAAFNQARTTSRYLTISLFGGDFGMYSADLSVRQKLVVNNLTPVPEPLGLIGLTIGCVALAARGKWRRTRPKTTAGQEGA